MLALLLGGLGLHKFYLNKPGQGVFYLLFCWTFIPAVIGLIEGLSYLFMNDEAFQRRFVNGAAQKPVDKRPIWIVWVAIIITALIVIFFN